MTTRPWLVSGTLVVLAASFLACVDLFHDTDSLVAPACSGAACTGSGSSGAPGVDAAPVALCTDDPAEAMTRAQTACSWLGACSGALGVNEPGTCLIEALRAFDCGFDPAAAPRAERATFWSCLQSASTAKTCGAVQKCTGAYPCGDSPPERGTNSICVHPDGGPERFFAVVCGPGEGPHAAQSLQNCAATGSTCVSDGKPLAGCGSIRQAAPASNCTASSCTGSTLTLCDSAIGREVASLDCTQGGAGMCGSGTDAGPGCVGLKVDAPQGCEPELPVGCSGTTAIRCRNAVYESVPCARAGLACQSVGGAEAPFEACRAPADAGACVPACDDAGNVHACMNGLGVTLDCAAQGLGPCRANNSGTETGFACSPP